MSIVGDEPVKDPFPRPNPNVDGLPRRYCPRLYIKRHIPISRKQRKHQGVVVVVLVLVIIVIGQRQVAIVGMNGRGGDLAFDGDTVMRM